MRRCKGPQHRYRGSYIEASPSVQGNRRCSRCIADARDLRHHSPTHMVVTHCNHAWRMAGDLEEKVRVVAEVTPRKSPGFGTNAEEPLQPRALHPGRGLGNAPGVV